MRSKPQASHLSAPCPRCGAIDRPLLSPGKGPHACKASCGSCGRFLQWLSLLAPSESLSGNKAFIREDLRSYAGHG